MFVKSVSLDGFKSYSKRTFIQGFDPAFNAITGLNGSGKSNILDAICFVLGIRNLSNVRASKLQDLVYKSGQAGIKEAVVSITFDNRDKNASPHGYEGVDEIIVCRKIIIGAPNKYFINGVKVTEKKVADMFATVQLNVNNPHFLIMQGRINTVINMKPKEILGLVEEAAGTKFFETKKEASLKTIAKKDERIMEIDEMLNERIKKQVDKLQKEKEKYQEFQRLKIKVNQGHKLLIAIQYRDLTGNVAESSEQVGKDETELAGLEKRLADAQTSLEQLQTQKAELEAELANESGTAEMEHNVGQLKDLLLRANQELKSLADEIKDLKKRHKDLSKEIQQDEEAARKKEDELKRNQEAHGEDENAGEEDMRLVEEAEKELDDLKAGRFQDATGRARTLQQQLIDAKKEHTRTATDATTAQRTVKRGEADLRKTQAQLASTSAPADTDRNRLQAIQQRIQKIQAEIAATGYNREAHHAARDEAGRLDGTIHRLQRDIDNWARGPNERLRFRMRDQFPESEIPGTVAGLIRVPDDRFQLALETAAGQQLYNVVTLNGAVSNRLFDVWPREYGRMTTLMLNDLSPRDVSQRALADAKRIAQQMGGDAWDAMELIEYAAEYRDAMSMVFGNKIICTNHEIASKVCYGVNVRTYSLDGDSYNPQGTVRGGAKQRKDGGTVFARMGRLVELETELKTARDRMAEVKEEDRRQMAASRACAEKERELNEQRVKEAELQTALSNNEHHRLTTEVQRLTKLIDEAQAALEKAEEEKTVAEAAVKELEAKTKNEEKLKKEAMAKATAKAKAARERLNANKDKFTRSKEVLGTLREELKQLAASVEKNKAELEELGRQTEEKEASYKAKESVVADEKKRSDEAAKALTEYKETLKKREQAIKKKDKDIKDAGDEIHEAKMGLDRVETALKKERDTLKVFNAQLEALLKNNGWIEAEKAQFGVSGGSYDYGTRTYQEEKDKQSTDQARYDELGQTINMTAMQKLNEVQNQAHELEAKRQRLGTDKKSLENAIKELDDLKRKKICSAFTKVNKDFGEIFSTLLPGAEAKLVPAQGDSPLQGIEFRVGFNGNWKESLGELSGGQKSLVALSLILAMLRFKPAPIYILDEVDAALDLSHTQNIGSMIKKHFKNAQFIVVSLKEGMFNNASVLFKTRFVDGASTVTRHSANK